MSMRDDAVSLKDMLDHAREAVALLRDTNRETFRDQRVLQLALTRLVEIVGGRLIVFRAPHARHIQMSHGPKLSGCEID
jgi:hypothetical protein